MKQQATIELAKDFGAHITSHPENKHAPVAAMTVDKLARMLDAQKTCAISSINDWHKAARPNPTWQQFNVQLGCHLEEVQEMLLCLSAQSEEDEASIIQTIASVRNLSDRLKTGLLKVRIYDKGDFLDSLCDQIVTAVGVGHCHGFDTVGALEEVNNSNWSKFDSDGNPIFDTNGKIQKSHKYRKPELTRFLGGENEGS